LLPTLTHPPRPGARLAAILTDRTNYDQSRFAFHRWRSVDLDQKKAAHLPKLPVMGRDGKDERSLYMRRIDFRGGAAKAGHPPENSLTPVRITSSASPSAPLRQG